jgi:hypothetical protein
MSESVSQPTPEVHEISESFQNSSLRSMGTISESDKTNNVKICDR